MLETARLDSGWSSVSDMSVRHPDGRGPAGLPPSCLLQSSSAGGDVLYIIRIESSEEL